MIGRPRRRHVIDRNGRLHRTPAAAAPAPQHSPSTPPSKVRRFSEEKKKRSWLKMTALGLGGLLVVIVVWIIAGSLITYGKVVDKNTSKKSPILSFLGEIKPGQLQGEGDGRVNVLLIGEGGKKHPGGTLADTIMVASFDPKNKEVALLSIPRDLYVPIPGTKNYSKINAVHSYGETNAKTTGGGPALLKKSVSQILDLPIHYYVRVDFSGLEDLVDTLGGVTVNVEKPIVDLSYPADDMIHYAPFRLNAGVQKLNGTTALKYVRSRHSSGSEGSDFARARRQQILITAIKEKALSAGVLANPKKITELMGVMGDHIKTDMGITEMQRFVTLWKDVDGSKIVSKVIDDGVNGPLVSQSGDARGFILLPRSGDYSEIQQIAHEIFSDPYLRQEKANISFINATGKTTTGTEVIKLLKSYGYTVTDNTPKGQAKITKTQLVDLTRNKPYTKQFLESRFKIKTTNGSNDGPGYDMVLTLGTDYQSPATSKSTQLKQVTPKPTATPSLSAGDAYDR